MRNALILAVFALLMVPFSGTAEQIIVIDELVGADALVWASTGSQFGPIRRKAISDVTERNFVHNDNNVTVFWRIAVVPYVVTEAQLRNLAEEYGFDTYKLYDLIETPCGTTHSPEYSRMGFTCPESTDAHEGGHLLGALHSMAQILEPCSGGAFPEASTSLIFYVEPGGSPNPGCPWHATGMISDSNRGAMQGGLQAASERRTLADEEELEAAGLPLQTCDEPGQVCLNDDRFKVEVNWRRPSGQTGIGVPDKYTGDSALFWFFNPENIELIVKVLNGCSRPQPAYWVFAGGLTNVEVDVRVTDLDNPTQVRTYSNPQGFPYQPSLDTNAFATCP